MARIGMTLGVGGAQGFLVAGHGSGGSGVDRAEGDEDRSYSVLADD